LGAFGIPGWSFGGRFGAFRRALAAPSGVLGLILERPSGSGGVFGAFAAGLAASGAWLGSD